MKRIKIIGTSVFLILATLFTTGCKQDDMEDIHVVVTNYPNEYIIS